MKLTTKLLKKIIKEEISRMNEGIGGKEGYFGKKALAPSPNVDPSQFFIEDKQEAVEEMASLMARLEDMEDYRYSSYKKFEGIMKKELDEKFAKDVREIYESAKDLAINNGWLNEGDFWEDEDEE